MCFAVLEAAKWKAACDGHTGNLRVLTGEWEPARAFGVALYVSAASIRTAQHITSLITERPQPGCGLTTRKIGSL